MIPRGEVAIITANLGRNAGMINDNIFTAIIIMSIATTVITPIMLKKSYGIKTITSKTTNEINNVNLNLEESVKANT
jgi:Kef-type K+ transport system membrane component KefB